MFMKKGFTLAEVLVTLGIIGVIAALTLPGVMQSYQKKVYVAQLQRVYNQFVNGTKSYMQNAGLTSLSDDNTLRTDPGRFLSKLFTVSKDCHSTIADCMATSYKSIGGENPQELNADAFRTERRNCITTDFGASICMGAMVHNLATVFVDLNGTAAPNIIGRDFFMFFLHQDGKVSSFSSSDTYSTTAKDYCITNVAITYGNNCFDRVRGENWTMDY